MSKLQLILLGHFDCLLPSGERISLSMRKAEVLLAYLALAPGIRHPRERLLNLLWSDRGEEQARNSLRQCLSAIKKSLGDVADLVIQVDRTTVRLIPDLVDVDALEFERLATDSGLEALSNAAALYAGEFLEGISIRDAASQDWLESERSRFKRQYIEILTNLGHTLLASRDPGKTIKIAERLVAEDTLGESGWRLLIRAYAENGDRSHALQAFKRCQQALRSELDVEPEAVTLELRDQIADSQTTVAPMPFRDSAVQEVVTALPTAGTDAKAPVDGSRAGSHRIAVLPFDNLSGDPEQEYFSDGITDSIILNLSMFPALQVKSRNSSFAFKQQIKSPGEISRELNVDYMVEGSIRKSQNRIRITVQLIEAAKGNQIWGKRYDADIENLFDLEEELSRSIAATVTGQIESDLQRIALSKGATDPQAYDLLLAGIYFCHKFDHKLMPVAVEKLNHCLELDPDNLRAHAQLVFCHIMNWLERWVGDRQGSLQLARKHALRAMELGPDLNLALLANAEYLTFDNALDKAWSYIERVLQTNPNDPETLAMKAMHLEFRGDFETALETAQLAYQLDPYHPWNQWNIAESEYLCGRYEAALATISRIGNVPGFIRIYTVAANVKLGRMDQAREQLQIYLQECSECMPDMPKTRAEWLSHSRDNAPFKDSSINQDHIDCMLLAGYSEDPGSSGDSESSNDLPTILVLPFSNLSGDTEQEYFSDGMTESIIGMLSSSRGLKVKSRHTSFAYRNSPLAIDQIGAELGVHYIVEGSIRKHADQVRISVQLSETASGNQIWGNRFDKPLAELFALEAELVQTIVGTISGRIGHEIKVTSAQHPAGNPKSYDYLMRGWYHGERFTPEDNAMALQQFLKCVESDPGNVDGHTLIAATINVQIYENWDSDRSTTRAQAEHHMNKALELEPDNAFAHAFMAEHLLLGRKYDQALFHSNRAIELDPSLPDGHSMKSFTLCLMGRIDEAVALAEQSLQIDPYHYYMGWNAGGVFRTAGDYQKAIDTFRSIPIPPPSLLAEIAACLVGLGELDEARTRMSEYLHTAKQQMPNYPGSEAEWRQLWYDSFNYRDDKDFEALFDLLLAAGLCTNLAEAQDDFPGIVVLPFENMSSDPEQEYFSNGITESIILSLSAFSGLKVKSRHASFAFLDSPKSITEISQALQVQYVVEGSIRRFDDQLRITVQLSDASTGNQLWGKRFDSSLADVFAVEEEMVKNIAGTISGRIDKELKIVALNKPKQDLKSFDHLMRGVYHLEKFNARDNLIAREQLQLSIKHDPDNGEAHSMLGETYVLDILENWTADRDEARRMMRQHAVKAIELEPDNAMNHAFMSEQLLFARDFDRAEMHADRAIELNPNLPDGYTMKCGALNSTRRNAEAIEQADISMQIDPFHPYIGWSEGEVYLSTGHYERALKAFRSIPHMPPSLHAQSAAALAGMGKMDEAGAEMRHYLELAQVQMATLPRSEKEWRQYWHEAMPFQYEEDSNRLFDLLLKAGLCDDLQEQPDNQPAIVVLPFKNLSDDAGQEYFSDGITTSLILNLGMFDGLTVRSQNSSFAYKNSSKSSQEIASEVEADFLIEGSIRKSGSKLRLSVQLVESASASQIWGKQYDADLEDILDLEQELSQTVAATISGRIGHRIQQSAVRKPASSLKSYDYLLRGLYHFGKMTVTDFQIAKREIGKCLEIDTENATAHTNLGMIHNVELFEGWSTDRSGSEQLASHHLRLAVEFDPDNALAHAYLAEHCYTLRDYERGEFHADRAIELNPTLADGYMAKAEYLGSCRRIEEALTFADQSLRLDPHSIGSNWVAGTTYRKAGQYDRAIKIYRSISHPPASIHAQIAICLNGLGMAQEARVEMMCYQQLARQQMPVYPHSEASWRVYWQAYEPPRYEEDFDAMFDQLVQAGLCEDLVGASTEVPSIAVLPFENMSGDPEQAFFSDGVTTDIIATLSKFQHMRVISRHSVLQYKNREASITDIASEQSVRYILEGSVRRSADKIRVNAELIDVHSEQNIWSERYDRDLDDIFAVQDDITRSITLALKVALTDGERSASRTAGTKNVKAWELVLLATDLQDSYIQQNVIDARKMILQAIELDPNYAYARVALGWTHWQEAYSDWTDSLEHSLADATDAVEQSLQLEPDNAEAWILASTIHITRHESEKAVAASNRALELEPGNAEIQALAGFAMNFIGNYEKATEHFHKAINLCPFCPTWYYLVGAQPHQDTGNLEKAAELLRRGIMAEPDSPLCRFYLADVLLEQGKKSEAQQVAAEIRKLDTIMNGRGLARSHSNDTSKRDRFLHNLEKLGLA